MIDSQEIDVELSWERGQGFREVRLQALSAANQSRLIAEEFGREGRAKFDVRRVVGHEPIHIPPLPGGDPLLCERRSGGGVDRLSKLSAGRTLDYAGVIAIARSGLPLPFTIFSGAAMTTAPVGGS